MIWQLTENKEWSALEKQFSWVAEMKHVEQHKIHHAEGNVASQIPRWSGCADFA